MMAELSILGELSL